jgi:hypothetical protein
MGGIQRTPPNRIRTQQIRKRPRRQWGWSKLRVCCSDIRGAGGGDRTRTTLWESRDFKSRASASFATPARVLVDHSRNTRDSDVDRPHPPRREARSCRSASITRDGARLDAGRTCGASDVAISREGPLHFRAATRTKRCSRNSLCPTIPARRTDIESAPAIGTEAESGQHRHRRFAPPAERRRPRHTGERTRALVVRPPPVVVAVFMVVVVVATPVPLPSPMPAFEQIIEKTHHQPPERCSHLLMTC